MRDLRLVGTLRAVTTTVLRRRKFLLAYAVVGAATTGYLASSDAPGILTLGFLFGTVSIFVGVFTPETWQERERREQVDAEHAEQRERKEAHRAERERQDAYRWAARRLYPNVRFDPNAKVHVVGMDESLGAYVSARVYVNHADTNSARE
jgi:hypothetical protein